MTTPVLTDSQLAQLKVLATAAALAYHDTTVPEGERVDVAASYAVHGDLRLVAADVLEVACQYAQGEQSRRPSAPAQVKKIKVGAVEAEFTPESAVNLDDLNAETWCARAARLRKESSSLAGLIRSPIAGMASGNARTPIFKITRPLGEA